MSAERTWCYRALFLSCVVLLSVAAGFTGYMLGARKASLLARTSLFLGLCGLEDLRNGRTQDGIAKLELVTFKNGLVLLSDDTFAPSGGSVPIALLGEYRRKWRSDRSEWSHEEKRLDQLLSAHAPPSRLMRAIHEGAPLAVIKEIVEADPHVIRKSQEHIVLGDPVSVAANACQTNVVVYLVERGAATDAAISALRAVGNSNAVRIIEDAMKH